jgi:hypothetical protein
MTTETTRVAPFSSVKSVKAIMQFAVTQGPFLPISIKAGKFSKSRCNGWAALRASKIVCKSTFLSTFLVT